MPRFLGALATIVFVGCANGGDVSSVTPSSDSSTDAKADASLADSGTDAVSTGCDEAIDTCPPAQYCSAVTHGCLDGCRLDTGCSASKPRCDVLSHTCVGCLTTDQCATGFACSAHQCVPGCSVTRPCDTGSTCCDGACVDLTSNAENCGACGSKCAVKNGVAGCSASTCAIASCLAEFADCDKSYESGCEAVLDDDPSNCGACGTVCNATHGTASCTAKKCALVCASNYADCNGKADDGCEVDLVTDPKNCGKCGVAPAEVCNGLDDDCDGKPDQTFACVRGSAPFACTTSCGTAGTQSCSDACSLSGCIVGETCNLVDDDCNGACDDVDGCRKGIHRAVSAATGEHFYTDSVAEASCCGFTVESLSYFYLYAASSPGLLPFYRCFGGTPGRHFYTQDAGCEGLGAVEAVMGFIATAETCGSIPLYRVYRAASHDHFYTTSDAERASTLGGGYVDQGIAGYVWSAPRG